MNKKSNRNEKKGGQKKKKWTKPRLSVLKTKGTHADTGGGTDGYYPTASN